MSTERDGPSAASSRARQQLYEIVFLLASETGGIEERLARAHMLFRAVDSSALPTVLRQRFDDICAALAALYPPLGQVDGVDQNKAVDLAMSMILLYDDMSRA